MNGCRWVCGWPLDPVSVCWMYVRVRGCMCGCPCEWVCVLDTIPYSIHSRNSACHLALHLPVDSGSSWLGDGHEMNGLGGLTGTDLSTDWFLLSGFQLVFQSYQPRPSFPFSIPPTYPNPVVWGLNHSHLDDGWMEDRPAESGQGVFLFLKLFLILYFMFDIFIMHDLFLLLIYF